MYRGANAFRVIVICTQFIYVASGSTQLYYTHNAYDFLIEKESLFLPKTSSSTRFSGPTN